MNNLENPRKTMQKTSNNIENHKQCLGKNQLCGALSRTKTRGHWARGALHARGCAPVEPPGLQASPWHSQRLPGPLGPGRPGSTYVLCSPGSFEGLSMPATPSPPTPTIILFWPLCGWKTQFPTFCVCCTQGCRKEDPQT